MKPILCRTCNTLNRPEANQAGGVMSCKRCGKELSVPKDRAAEIEAHEEEYAKRHPDTGTQPTDSSWLRGLGWFLFFAALLFIGVDYSSSWHRAQSAIQQAAIAADACARTLFLLAIAWACGRIWRRTESR